MLKYLPPLAIIVASGYIFFLQVAPDAATSKEIATSAPKVAPQKVVFERVEYSTQQAPTQDETDIPKLIALYSEYISKVMTIRQYKAEMRASEDDLHKDNLTVEIAGAHDVCIDDAQEYNRLMFMDLDGRKVKSAHLMDHLDVLNCS